MSAYRLDSVSPTLAERFRRAPPTMRRKAAQLACEIAVSSVGLWDEEVLLALEALRSDAPAASTLRGQLERLAAQLDDEYLRLHEEGEEEQEEDTKKTESMKFFSKARAASAVMFALSDDVGQLHEAIYEALASLDDPTGLVQSVDAVLGVGRPERG